ncbi:MULTISPECIES: response regulator [Halomonas]|uniref:response regulator n=1 Tax=Halomonas TaxID=2745 RepID=UPI001865C96B|nr:response regulator [Halomonas citrativorans]
MNILIVEDQKEKSDDICSFLENFFSVFINIQVRSSLRSGLKSIISEKFDLVVLDMSMPNFDPSSEDPVGGTPDSFAGKEFLAQMDLRERFVPVVVVTQYATFSKGQVELEDLDAGLKNSYPNFYLGAVYYSSADEGWKNAMSEIIGGI